MRSANTLQVKPDVHSSQLN